MSNFELLVFSNRVPDPFSTHAGGLTEALKALSRLNGKKAVWMGPNDKGMEPWGPVKKGALTYKKFLCDQELYDSSYLLCNEEIWLGFHGVARDYPPTLARKNLNAYKAMAKLSAQEIKKTLSDFDNPDKVVLNIQDFHNLSLAKELRLAGVNNPVGLFLHVPFPRRYNLGVLPEMARAQVLDLMKDLLYYDQLGFQTKKDADNFCEFAREFGSATQMEDGALAYGDRRIGVGVFPVSIDPDYGNHIPGSEAIDADVKDVLKDDRKLILGVDRIDPAKNLPGKIRAFGQFLDNHPGAEKEVCLVQIAPTCRASSAYYTDERDAVLFAAQAVNARFGTKDRPAIRLLNKTIDHDDVYRLHAHADVFAINSVDGAMLGAYEFPAAKHDMMKFDPTVKPGALIISSEAGASTIVGENAIMIRAGSVPQLAAAYSQALDMPIEVRLRNQEAMMGKILAYDDMKWLNNFVSAIVESADPDKRIMPKLINSLKPVIEQAQLLLPISQRRADDALLPTNTLQ